MDAREKLNRENYQQAVKFAEHFATDLKQELTQEAHARYQFDQAQLEKAQLQNLAQKRPLVRRALISLLAIGLLGAVYYAQTERFERVQAGLTAHETFTEQVSLEQAISKNDRYLLSLQERLRQEPNNGELWFELGQAYALSNDFSAALTCYGYAEKLLGKRAAILGAQATAYYYDNGQKMTNEINGLIQQALALDPEESNSLLLLASDGFLNNHYQQALDYWRKVLDSNNDALDRRAIIQSMAMAKQMLEGQR